MKSLNAKITIEVLPNHHECWSTWCRYHRNQHGGSWYRHRLVKVRELGGLCVIGTERHESRRIDNQLRGRSGRQGDPGESQFYLSLEDDLMKRFGSERLKGIFERLNMSEEAIESRMLTRQVEAAQKRVEGNNYDTRKQVLQYDDVMREQREIIYAQRYDVITADRDLAPEIQAMLKRTIERVVDGHARAKQDEKLGSNFELC